MIWIIAIIWLSVIILWIAVAYYNFKLRYIKRETAETIKLIAERDAELDELIEKANEMARAAKQLEQTALEIHQQRGGQNAELEQ